MSDLTKAIEEIQNCFLRFLAFKCGNQRHRHTPYSPLLTLTSLETLPIRRTRLNLCFTFKFLNGIINCSELLSKFNFLIPNTHTRQSNTFYAPFHRTNYAKNALIIRLMGQVNEYNIDLFLCNNIVFFNVFINSIMNIV